MIYRQVLLAISILCPWVTGKSRMLRRKPTRVELTTDDVQDYEIIKQRALLKKQREEDKEVQAKFKADRWAAGAAKRAEHDEKKAAAREARLAAKEVARAANRAVREAARRDQVASRIGLRPS